MQDVQLSSVAVLLAAVAIAAPIARTLGIGTVLGYLAAGAIVGPFGLGGLFSTGEAKEILHLAEFGVVLLLFLIGLELRPRRLWSMRSSIFGLGGAQVVLTAMLLAGIAVAFALPWKSALFVGLALALSSTAFALQVMEENGELSTRHGRLGFAVLLFQDLAAIPLIALAPLFAVASAAGGAPHVDLWAAARTIGVIAAVAGIGWLTLDLFVRVVARTRVREAMTAAALLTVVTAAAIMQWAGVSASLGAFIAGALLAESSYRHQLEADIQPFEGLLLGLFFTAIGMSLDLDLLVARWREVVLLAAILVAVKTLVLNALGLWQGLNARGARRLGLSLSQGGEFAFVLFAAGFSAGVLTADTQSLLVLVVTVSMIATPFLLLLDSRLAGRSAATPAYDALPEAAGHVVIAGFGRYGQIVARILRARKIPFTALDISADQIELVKRFGSEAFYGDASRPDILEAAKVGDARAFVLAIDDVDASLRIAEFVTSRWPKVPIYARARNRNHAHRYLDLGVTRVQRETFLSALETARQLLTGLGDTDRAAARTVATFRAHDERRLAEDYKHYTDLEKMQAKARSDAATLEKLFEEDAREAEAAAAAAKAAE
jgi:glutathione-regulated potassium-efflux system protein KefB